MVKWSLDQSQEAPSLRSWFRISFSLFSFQSQTCFKNSSLEKSFRFFPWLAKPISLIEILEQLSSEAEENMPYLLGTIFSLVHLGYEDWAEENTYFLRNTEIYPLLHLYFSSWKKDPKGCLDTFFSSSFSPFSLLHLETLSLIIERCIKKKKTLKALSYFEKLPKVLPAEYQMHIDELHLTLLLLEKKKKQAEGIFSKYTIETIAKENSPLRTLYGCFLGITKGKKKALDFLCSTSQKLYPKTKNLLSHFVAGYCSPSWEDSAFYAEKKELYKQLFLYYHSIQNPIEEKKVANLLRKYQKASLGD